MKTKRLLFSLGLCLALCAPFAGCGQSEPPAGGGTVTEQPPKEDPSKEDPPKEETKVDDLDHFDLDKYLEPIFEGDHVYNETALLLLDEEGKLAPIQMYYPITEIVSVRNFALDTLFKAGKDYVLKDGNIEVPAGSALYSVACPHEYYYTDTYVNNGEWWPEADGEGGQMQTEAQNGDPGLTRYQIAVTYRHESKWKGEIIPDKSDKLPKINEKLLNGEEVSIVCLGASTYQGWTASGYAGVNIAPHCPPLFDLTIEYLKKYKNPNIKATNLSVGGKTSEWGAGAAQITKTVAAEPDLVIVGFGGNEAPDRNWNRALYRRNMTSIINKVRAVCPDTEFLLVGLNIPNAEVGYQPGVSMWYQQEDFNAELAALETEYEGVAHVDVLSMHKELLTRKKFRDSSTNNINHGNDFMHRFIASLILRTLIGK